MKEQPRKKSKVRFFFYLRKVQKTIKCEYGGRKAKACYAYVRQTKMKVASWLDSEEMKRPAWDVGKKRIWRSGSGQLCDEGDGGFLYGRV